MVYFIYLFDQTLAEQLYHDKGLLYIRSGHLMWLIEPSIIFAYVNNLVSCFLNWPAVSGCFGFARTKLDMYHCIRTHFRLSVFTVRLIEVTCVVKSHLIFAAVSPTACKLSPRNRQ